jgi:outer membrane biogenesis lipoprotein LolB
MTRRSPGAQVIVCLLAAVAFPSCGASLMNLPDGPGAPAADTAAALAEATAACRTITSFAADASVSGSAGGRRLRARLSMGLQAPAAARLEAIGPFARPFFILTARGDTATLLLNDDNRILQGGRPADVLEAITGVPLDAAALRDTLTGCPSNNAAGSGGRARGDDWRIVDDGPRSIYLHRDGRSSPWRLVAAVHLPSDAPAWRAEYRDFADGLPRTIRLASTDRDRFNLRLVLSGIELNGPLPPEAFEIKIPPSAQPITLDELRRAGPLRDQPR